MSRKFLFIDFEFYNSNNVFYDLVCCHIMTYHELDDCIGTSDHSFWLHQDLESQRELFVFLTDKAQEGYILVGWSATAELRSLLSIGLDIDIFKIIDVQVEFKLFCNTSSITMRERSLNAARHYFLGTKDEEKDETRDLILLAEKGYEYSLDDADKIMEYCKRDVHTTQELFKLIAGYLVTTYGLQGTYIEDAIRRGAYIRACTFVEFNGYPVHIDRLQRVNDKFDAILLAFIKSASEAIRKCYVLEVKSKKYNIEKFVFKQEIFAQVVQEQGLGNIWKKTPSGRYTTDSKWLSDNAHLHPFIDELKSIIKKVSCLKYLRPKQANERNKRTVWDYLSGDDRIRCWVNPFGTKTGRNAPPATGFIPAQASWERVLISPPPGRVILGLDYSAQEILIMGIISSDDALIQSYASGDHYLSFGKAAKLLPEDATKSSHGDTRTKILKPVCLGLTYGMGVSKLALSIKKSEDECRDIVDRHKKVYRTYWDNTFKFLDDYKGVDTYYRLSDDWGFRNIDSYGTLLNWRIQSWGGRVLRKLAVELTSKHFRERDVDLIILLHDAVYIEIEDGGVEYIESMVQELRELMIRVFHELLPCETKIRVDCDIHRADDFWIEEKAEDTWNAVKEFIV